MNITDGSQRRQSRLPGALARGHDRHLEAGLSDAASLAVIARNFGGI
jgi:hypothetical protein